MTHHLLSLICRNFSRASICRKTMSCRCWSGPPHRLERTPYQMLRTGSRSKSCRRSASMIAAAAYRRRGCRTSGRTLVVCRHLRQRNGHRAGRFAEARDFPHVTPVPTISKRPGPFSLTTRTASYLQNRRKRLRGHVLSSGVVKIVSTREQKFAPQFCALNLDSNRFRPVFDAFRRGGVNHLADRAESPRESESHRGLVFDSGRATWTRT